MSLVCVGLATLTTLIECTYGVKNDIEKSTAYSI